MDGSTITAEKPSKLTDGEVEITDKSAAVENVPDNATDPGTVIDQSRPIVEAVSSGVSDKSPGGVQQNKDKDMEHVPIETGPSHFDNDHGDINDKDLKMVSSETGVEPSDSDPAKYKDGRQEQIETGVSHVDNYHGKATDKDIGIVPMEVGDKTSDNTGNQEIAKDKDVEQIAAVTKTEKGGGADLVNSVANDMGATKDGSLAVSVCGNDETCIMEGDVRMDKRQYHLKLSNMALTWVRSPGKSAGPTSVRVQEIISVKPYRGKNSSATVTERGFTLSYVKHKKKYILKRDSHHFVTSAETAHSWTQNIQNQINSLVDRPKKTLVLVNPVSGKRQAPKMCRKYIEPIFKDANIQTEIIVTEKAHHTEEILAGYDIPSIDSLVLVGGDGLYHEAVNGLQTRLMSEAGLDRNVPESAIQKIDLPMGIVPCGTGNGIADAMYGCKDIETAVLAIVIGRRTASNMFSVFSGGKLVAYSSLLIGYGLFGDLIYAAENRRSSLGIFRYPVTMAEYLLIRTGRRMNLTIDYLSPDPDVEAGNQSPTDQPSTSHTATGPNKTSDGSDTTERNENLEAKRVSLSDNKNLETKQVALPDIENTETKQVLLHDNENPNAKCAASPDSESVEAKQVSLPVSDQINGNWKTIQGPFTLVVVFPGDLLQMMSSNVPTNNGRTRFLLAKPYSRVTVLKLFASFITKDMSIMNSDKLIHDLVLEYKVRVDEPSEPRSDVGVKEHLLNIDGEPFTLPEPAFHVRFHSERIWLFSSVHKTSMGET